MQQLWAPWRMAYIKGEVRDAGCVFCGKAQHPANDASEHVIARSAHTFAVLNRYPYANGHMMIVPYAHVPSLEELPPAALSDLMLMSQRTLRILRETAKPPAFNIGANIGAAAGAGIAAHFHLHIVPRWPGDVNFMTSIGATRVIPEALDSTAAELKAAWERLYG